MVYLYVPTEVNDADMSTEVKEKYQSILNMRPTIRKSITLTTRGASNTGAFPSFSTTDSYPIGFQLHVRVKIRQP